LNLSDFHYDLPPELIAQQPAERRDQSRLLVLDRQSGDVRHHTFADLPEIVSGDEVFVFNDTRVIPARLWARKPGGGRVEILALSFPTATSILAMTRSSKPLRPSLVLVSEGTGTRLLVASVPAPGRALIELPAGIQPIALLRNEGSTPLPPYIHRGVGADRPEDRERYQTVFARHDGSVAAPTAGLHFTPEILERLQRKGCSLLFVTLHVGPGTFLPVRVDKVEDHRMEHERYEIPEQTAAAIREAKAQRRPILAVGTTTVRTIESAFRDGTLHAGPGETDLFIHPGFRFRTVDRLLTNFHLPGSTLIMLASALAGREKLLEAYRQAVNQRYRFYSYGDCMIIR